MGIQIVLLKELFHWWCYFFISGEVCLWWDFEAMYFSRVETYEKRLHFLFPVDNVRLRVESPDPEPGEVPFFVFTDVHSKNSNCANCWKVVICAFSFFPRKWEVCEIRVNSWSDFHIRKCSYNDPFFSQVDKVSSSEVEPVQLWNFDRTIAHSIRKMNV